MFEERALGLVAEQRDEGQRRKQPVPVLMRSSRAKAASSKTYVQPTIPTTGWPTVRSVSSSEPVRAATNGRQPGAAAVETDGHRGVQLPVEG